MEYALNISLPEEAMDAIAKAHQKIVLVKHTAGDADIPVAWVCFEPWRNNTVKWENDFAIYQPDAKFFSSDTIRKLSDKQAATGVCYDFNEGYFHKPAVGENPPKNSYFVENRKEDTDDVTADSAQGVVINGEAFGWNPINTGGASDSQSAVTSPAERLDVYLVNDIEDSTVASHIQSKALSVVYGEGRSSHTLKYNDATGQFYQD